MDASEFLRDALARRRLNALRNEQDGQLAQIEETVRFTLIEEFVAQKFPDAGREEAIFLREAISLDFETGDLWYLGEVTPLARLFRRVSGFGGEYHLGEFLQLGMRGIRKRRRTEWRWAVARMVWPAIRNLVALAIALGIYAVLQGQFETVVVSILIMIYATGSWQALASAVGFNGGAYAADKNFLEIRELLGQPPTISEKKQKSALKDRRLRDLAEIFGYPVLALINLVALWHLLGSVGWL